MILLVTTAIASVAMAWALLRDVAYAWSSSEPRDLGDLATVAPDRLEDDTFVRGQGLLGIGRAIRYERPFAPGGFRLMPIARADQQEIWVEVHVPAGAEDGRFLPPTDLRGRLVRLSHAGLRHRGIEDALLGLGGKRPAPDAWLLIQDRAPSDEKVSTVLLVMFVGFALWSVATIAKLLKRPNDLARE